MDQAEQLRIIKANRQSRPLARVITVTSGKGGVGKSNTSINLAIQFRKMGKKVIILDADFGLANIEIMFGAVPKHNLCDLIYQGKQITEIITWGPMERCVVVDVSSDELCFNSSQYYEPESLLYLCYDLPGEQGIRKYEMIGRVAEAPAVGDSKGEYRHRIVFFDADTETKEDLVRYIFEEERKSRKKRGQ